MDTIYRVILTNRGTIVYTSEMRSLYRLHFALISVSMVKEIKKLFY